MHSVNLVRKVNRIIIFNKYRKINISAIPKDMFIKLNKKYDIKYKISITNDDIIDSFSDEINYSLFHIINTFDLPLNNIQKDYISNIIINIINNNDLNEKQIKYFEYILKYFKCI